MQPLEGIKVLDLTRVLAGPWATQLLADLGADVIKIERPGEGDDTRAWGPPYAEGSGGERESAYFLCANRGKQSVAIDMASAKGQALIRDLAMRCDVVVENFKVGGLAKYGFDYAGLSAINPKIVYCSITGFGQTGPYASRPGYDVVAQAMGGIMSITGEPQGEPMKTGVALTDILTGLYAANAIQAALRLRDNTGNGSHLDLALLDVQVATLANQALNYLVSGDSPARLGNAHPSIVPYQTFRTQDGWIMLAVGNDGQFARLCGVIDRPDLAADPLYAANSARVANRAVLVPLLQDVLDGWLTAEVTAALTQAGVPANPINTVAQAFADPQVVARGLRIDQAHATAGTVPGVRSPILIDGVPATATGAPPTLGQHTQAVLARELGLDAQALSALEDAGVIGGPATI